MDKCISIESFEELSHKMKSMEFSVTWEVTSEIGPDWIGSNRTVDFYLDDFLLGKNAFIEELSNTLIKLIPIPDKSKDHLITGQGDITLENGHLKIDYDWDAKIPYQNPNQYEEGQMVFYP